MARKNHLWLMTALILLNGLGCTGKTKKDVGIWPGTRQPAAERTFEPNAKNSPAGMRAPYVIVVSIDGYRHDYTTIFRPPNLSQLAQEGVAARSLQPIYPSKTFPSHYSMATGLYADRHGIVDNEFYDSERRMDFAIEEDSRRLDGRFYNGTPFWITAQNQGVLTATFFWPGSDAGIQGRFPNYYYPYDSAIPNSHRVDQVLQWLTLPEDRRPHLITTYFSDVDTAGHYEGVGSQAVRTAVQRIDAEIGRLRAGIAASSLPVNLIIVSDHGMENLDENRIVQIARTPELMRFYTKFRVVGHGPQLHLYLKEGEDAALIPQLEAYLESVARNFRVLRRDEMVGLHYSNSARVGDLVIDPDMPYLVALAGTPEAYGGNHGWDAARYEKMHGIFYASGPAFNSRVQIPTFENIHVNPLVLKAIGLRPEAGIDGNLNAFRSALKRQHMRPR